MTTTIPDRGVLVDEAIAQAGHKNFGDEWFFENIDALIPSLNDEARLNEAGAFGARSMIVNALVNRLRHMELLRKHPEIGDQAVTVAAIIVGLPRTGSTMLHRMLAAADGMTGIRWFEAQNYAPFPGEARGDASLRREAAAQILDYMLQAIPDLMSIHPMSIDQPDEEVIILGQLFSSTMIEATYFTPSYTKWLSMQDHTQAYQDLREILKFLQWQDAGREDSQWVLKTPGHLMALHVAARVFPEAKIVMTHRDPKETVPSYCSMEKSLYSLGSDQIDPQTIGSYWPGRLADLLAMFERDRKQMLPERFIDISYQSLLNDPLKVGSLVRQAAGLDAGNVSIGDMQQWIDFNKREDRAPHQYSSEEFKLSHDKIDALFSAYRQQYFA